MKINGYLLFADFFENLNEVNSFRKNLIKYGFEIQIDENISNNVT